jgi:hypothetical protein
MAATTRTWRAIRLAFFGVAIASLVIGPRPARADERASSVPGYATVLRSFNVHLSSAQARDLAEHVLLLSSYYSLDPRLLVAIVAVESGWHPNAVSPAGAQGLGQLMPGTANALSVQAFEKYENLDGTARYLRRLLKQYAALPEPARYQRALAGYNAGPEAVARYGGVPPFAETQAYVVRVMSLWHQVGSMLQTFAKTATPAIAHAPPATSIIAHAPPATRASAPTVVIAPPPLDGSVATFAQLETAALQVAAEPPLPAVKISLSAPIKTKAMPSARDTKPISSIALVVPPYVNDGEPIPVGLRVRGSGTLVLVARIGPTIIERRTVSSSTTRVLLRPLTARAQTRLVSLRATAPGVRSRETVTAAVAPATRSAFVSP